MNLNLDFLDFTSFRRPSGVTMAPVADFEVRLHGPVTGDPVHRRIVMHFI